MYIGWLNPIAIGTGYAIGSFAPAFTMSLRDSELSPASGKQVQTTNEIPPCKGGCPYSQSLGASVVVGLLVNFGETSLNFKRLTNKKFQSPQSNYRKNLSSDNDTPIRL